MATTALNHATKPLLGKSSTPAGNCRRLSWDYLESCLRRAGEIRPGETAPCFIVADDGVWLVLERS